MDFLVYLETKDTGSVPEKQSHVDSVDCQWSSVTSFLESYLKFHFMCSRVTQGHWDLQDLKERMENGYKASADPDFNVIPSRVE